MARKAWTVGPFKHSQQRERLWSNLILLRRIKAAVSDNEEKNSPGPEPHGEGGRARDQSFCFSGASEGAISPSSRSSQEVAELRMF